MNPSDWYFFLYWLDDPLFGSNLNDQNYPTLYVGISLRSDWDAHQRCTDDTDDAEEYLERIWPGRFWLVQEGEFEIHDATPEMVREQLLAEGFVENPSMGLAIRGDNETMTVILPITEVRGVLVSTTNTNVRTVTIDQNGRETVHPKPSKFGLLFEDD